MTNQFEQKNIPFRKHTGKETMVQVITETPVTHGAFGDVFDAVVRINGHKKKFIIKKYFTLINESENTAKRFTQKAFINYSLAKNAGLKVFPTFRIGEDGKSILMTTGFSDNQICIGSNGGLDMVDLKQSLIEEIVDVDKFLINFFNEGLRAAEKGLAFSCDVFFFVLGKDKPIKIDFILGDLDNLYEANLTKQTGNRNMKQIKNALTEFCQQNIDPNFAEEFLAKVEYHYKQGVISVNNSSELSDELE